jgi:hypothetical protein
LKFPPTTKRAHPSELKLFRGKLKTKKKDVLLRGGFSPLLSRGPAAPRGAREQRKLMVMVKREYKEIKEAARAHKKASFSPTWNTVDFRSLLEDFVG